MTDICRSRGIWSRSNSRLITEKSSFYTIHHARATKSAEYSAKVKCLCKDTCEYSGQQGNIHNYYDERNKYIRDTHKGHEKSRRPDNSRTTAEQAIADNKRKHKSYYPWTRSGIIKAVGRKRRLQIIRCQHIKSKSVSEYKQDRKHDSQRTAMQCRFDVIRRTSIASLRTFLFIYLSQSALDKCRRATDQSYYPHPEHRAKSAKAKRRRYSYYVSRTHTRCRRYHQCLKGRDSLFVSGLLAHDSYLLSKHSKLNESCSEHKVQSPGHQENYQCVTV